MDTQAFSDHPPRPPGETPPLSMASWGPSHWPLPLLIGHRGAGTLAPENTLAAFRHGAALGWRAFECDVKLSRDGVAWLLHDDTLERTTSACGLASERDWRELSQLDAGRWHSPTFAGEPPASLQAVACFCLAQGFGLNLELKPCPGQAVQTGRGVAHEVQRLWGPAVAQGRAHWPLLSSFEPDALLGAAQAQAHLPRALLLEAWADSAVAQAQRLGALAVVCHHASLSAEGIQALHAAGLRALCYTVNESSEAQRLLAAGIDGLISDTLTGL
jgi:glycerophosphoryl diester phosphodiesterase